MKRNKNLKLLISTSQHQSIDLSPSPILYIANVSKIEKHQTRYSPAKNHTTEFFQENDQLCQADPARLNITL